MLLCRFISKTLYEIQLSNIILHAKKQLFIFEAFALEFQVGYNDNFIDR